MLALEVLVANEQVVSQSMWPEAILGPAMLQSVW